MVVLRERRQMMTVSPPSDKPVGTGGGRGWGRLGDHLPPDFGKLVNPISTRGVDYAHHVTTRPPPPDFQNFLQPYTSSSCTVGNFLSPNLVEPEIKLIARQFDSIWLFQLVNNATVIHVGKWVQVKLFYSHIPSWCKKYIRFSRIWHDFEMVFNKIVIKNAFI